MKNLPAVQTKKFKDVADIARDPREMSKLQNYIDEAVREKQMILDKQESIKTLRQSAVDQVGIEPKMFNMLVSMFYNNNFDQKKEELSKLEEALEAIMQVQRIASGTNVVGSDE